jgi:hypothetical protein
MAQGIQDLGTVGYLYKTAPDGTTIITTERNTVDGVRAMQQQGTANAPVVAARSAVGKITVSSVASAGSITNIDIAAVNQIGANIVVTSSTASVVATQIATAINAFTPASGDNYTAQAVGAVVSVFSSASNGSAANGLTITVSVTDITIVTTTTAFTNGSSQIGVYDTTFGYRFYINANYNGDAVPTSLTNAVEITEYMTVRGLQSGIMTVSATVATDRITGLSRSCAITQIIVDTESSAASDVLAFIQTEGFVEGDSIRLRALDTGRITTLEDATVTTSPIGTKNIYLTDAQSYALAGLVSIALQLRNDPTLGLCWIETSRSIANSVVVTTVAGINTLISASTIIPGSMYLITDIGDAGVYVTGTDVNSYDAEGIHVRRVPSTYARCWSLIMVAPTINLYYRFNQNVYQSVTGAIGTDPDADTTNWLLITKSNNTYYTSEYHPCGINNPSLLGTWPIIWERDFNNNFVSQSYTSSTVLGFNAFSVFCWMVGGSATKYGNTVIDSVFDCANSDGSVYDNTLTETSTYSGNILTGATFVVGNVIYSGGVVTGNIITLFSNNIINGILIGNYIGNCIGNDIEGTVDTIGSFGAGITNVNDNYVAGTLSAVATSGSSNSILKCRVDLGSYMQNLSFSGSGGSINVCTAKDNSIFSCAIVGAGSVNNCSFLNGSQVSIINTVNANIYSYLIFSNGDASIASSLPAATIALARMSFIDTVLEFWEVLGASSDSSFIKTSTYFQGTVVNSLIENYSSSLSPSPNPTYTLTDNIVIGNNFSDAVKTLNLDDAGRFASNTITFTNSDGIYGIFKLTGTGAKNITDLVAPPTFKNVFIADSSQVFTFTTTGRATVAGTKIAGSAASFALTKTAATGAADQVTIQAINSLNTITSSNILV